MNIGNKDYKYNVLSQFLEEQGKQSDSNYKSIIDHRVHKGSYYLKDKETIHKFFTHYNNALGCNLRIQENQRTQRYSGIYIDIDMLSKKEIKVDNKKLLNACFKEFENMVKFERLRTSAFILKRHTTSIVDGNKLKDGYHIIFPGLMVSQGFKKEYLRNLTKNKSIIDIFSKCTNSIDSVIDQNLDHNQTVLYGSSKSEDPPYKLDQIYKIKRYKQDDYTDISEDTREYNNLPLEMSILYEGEIKQTIFETNLDSVVVSKSKNTNNEAKLLRLKDEDYQVPYILSIIDSLPFHIYENTGSWKTFIKAIANISLYYKPIAIYGSQKCPEEFDKPKTLDLIDKMFTEEESQGNAGWGMGKLINWVKEYCPMKLKTLQEKNVVKTLISDAYATKGELSDDRITKIAITLFNGKHKTTYNQSLKDNPLQWYSQCNDGPHAFKWKSTLPNKIPSEFMREIGDTFNKLTLKAVAEMKNNLDFATGDTKGLETIISRLEKKSTLLEGVAPKKRIIENLSHFLMDENFYHILDKHPYAIGVNGGILLLPDKKGVEPMMIRHENDYNVSINLERTWKPYDPEDPDIKEVFNIIKDGFYLPEELDHDNIGYDKETMDFYLFNIARGLVKTQKSPLMTIMWGGGGNIKSTLAALEQNTFGGPKWCCPIEAEYLSQPMPAPNEPHPKLMNMVNKHYVNFNESNKDRILNEGKLKFLLSPGESIQARGLYANDSYFMLYAIFILRSNFLLTILSTNHAIWRRLLFIFCQATFVDEDKVCEPWHRINNEYYIEEWVKEKRICDAYFRIIVYYYCVLLNKYDGKIKNVPHDRIKQWTEDVRNDQDQMRKFIKEVVIKEKDITRSISLDDTVEKFIEWYKRTDNSDPLAVYPKVVIQKLMDSELKFNKETKEAIGWSFKY